VLLLHLLALWALERAFRTPTPHALPAALYTRVLLPSTPQATAPRTAGAREAARAPAHPDAPELLAQASTPRPARTAPQARTPAHETARGTPHGADAAAPASAARAAVSPTAASSTAAAPPAASSPASVASRPRQAAPAAPAPPRPTTQGAAPPGSAPSGAPASTPAAATASTATSAVAEALDAWPLPTRLDYALTGYFRGPLHGNGELEWRRQGRRYELRLSGSALIDFSYTSTGTIDGDWLAPDDYVEQVLMRGKTVRFDRAAGLLRFSATGSTMPIPAHLLDSASVFMQLAQRLRTQPGQFRDGAHLRFQVARPSGTTTWDFLVAGRESVDTRLGALDTWHLLYQPPARDDLGAEVWLAPSLQGLPVQIRLQHGSDDYLQFTLRRALQQASPGAASAPPSAPR
jgi:hypothetical protein